MEVCAAFFYTGNFKVGHCLRQRYGVVFTAVFHKTYQNRSKTSHIELYMHCFLGYYKPLLICHVSNSTNLIIFIVKMLHISPKHVVIALI